MRLSISAVLLAYCASCTSAAEATKEGPSLDFGILEWIHNAPGGFYHPDQEFRADPVTGGAGVFAAREIPKGTVLVTVPWSHLIKSDDPSEEGQLCCGLVRRLALEMRKGEDSFYAPYVKYLTSQSDSQIPSGWSDSGQRLLQEIVGRDVDAPLIPPEEPTEWLSNDWYTGCGGDPTDALSTKAALLVIQRSDDHILIPAYDMYNHRNGDYFNTETTITPDVNHVTVATHDIAAGDQIYISYNMCRECDNRVHGYGTAEILRDYGFVESLPHKWHFIHGLANVQFDLDVNAEETAKNDTLKLTWHRHLQPPKEKADRAKMSVFFRRQIRRLQRLKHIDYRTGNPGMPESEWETSWKFQTANIQAMAAAIQAMEALKQGEVTNTQILFVSNITLVSEYTMPHYDPLGFEVDDVIYSAATCDSDMAQRFPYHKEVETTTTHYQDVLFEINPETKDVLMCLDGIIQIASLYRPHYHEYFVHTAARYLDKVQKVIFIGGGDSMLLHEVLKYPELELVVGLELDQIVTRKSFKHFQTQPHFDDPRVEWWFGDATKSLLLLTKEYWQSFDLVLVDLSETVMSLSVTGQLDVFDALALLLKPEGVLVKNELYMETISNVFDYSVEICYQSPIICDQVMVMGSNQVDFLHAPVKDHGIETLLYTPLDKKYNRHEFLHDYRRNGARGQGKCEPLPKLAEQIEQSKSAGIMEFVEAEKTKVPLDKSLVAVFEKIVTGQGFHLARESVFEETTMILLLKETTMILLLKEGYIVARLQPDKMYCNLDINIWGNFHKMKSLSSALTKALGSDLVSSFRVVVGGMYGSSTWDDDRKLIGPQVVQARDCSESEAKNDKGQPTQEEVITAAFEESMTNLVRKSQNVAVVLCGTAEEDCLAATLLEKSKKVGIVVRLSTCSGLDQKDSNTLYDCEIATLSHWKEALGDSKADLFIADTSAPKEMLQIVNSAWSIDKFLSSVLAETNVVLAWSNNPQEEGWRRHFLDRYRKQHNIDPVSRAEYHVRIGSQAVELGVVSAGDDAVVYHFEAVESGLRKKFQKHKVVEVELQIIYGGQVAWWDPWNPKEFLQTDYPEAPGLEQYYEQKPLAQHTVFQLEPVPGKSYDFNKMKLNQALQVSLDHVGFKCPTKFAVDNIGEGYVMVCLDPKWGTIILTFDGRQHLDISYHLKDDDETEIDRFIDHFKRMTEESLIVALRDDFPRGAGRVVNFEEDMMTSEQRSKFFENIGKKDTLKERAAANQDGYDGDEKHGHVVHAKDGSCSNSDTDEHFCWPAPP